jgi:multiple sugar transport system ATP-binding protein
MARLILHHVTKVFPGSGAVRAVDDLSLEIQRGELFVLLGPSGCGKTTTIRLIAGLEPVTSGRIFLGGEAIEEKPPRERNVSVAFQYPALLPQLNVFQNLTLGLTLRGFDEYESTEKVQHLSESLGITPLLSRAPETLSGGQQQRVALARALITRPMLFLLDEPLANLDPLTRNELRQAIRALQQEFRTTTVYVTHDQHEAAALADRVAIMNHGRIEQIGTPAELYQNPVNLFVARFFGPHEINLVRGQIEDGGFMRDTLGVPLPNHHHNGKEAFLAFRPNEITVDPSGPLIAKVASVENLGWTQFVKVSLGSIIVRMEHQAPVALGVTLRLRLLSFFLFDPESGVRLP